MAANPFQRFARGAVTASPTPRVSIKQEEERQAHKVEERMGNNSPAAVRKRKRTLDDGAHSLSHKREPSDDQNDRNALRVQLLQQLIDARCDGPDAPIDLYGTQACVFQPSTTRASIQRFHILVAALLSSQTQDGITHAAMQRLHTHLCDSQDEERSEGLTIAKVRLATAERLEELLVPVGFYRRKAQQLKVIGEMLHREYNDDIPRTLDGLLALPGIGPKIARVILLLAWDDIDAGLIVDTHIHRLSHRLGWVDDSGTTTPEQTRVALEEWVPRSYWREFSRLVVGFGQNVCVAVHPKCIDCPLAPHCPSAFRYRHPKKKQTKDTTSIQLQYEEL